MSCLWKFKTWKTNSKALRARLERMEDDNDQVNQRITAYQMQIKDSQALIEKYTEQQNNVRNNREFESLSKEIEYQTLEIELCEKRIRECKAQVEQKAEGLEGTRERFNQRQADLEAKNAELEAIVAETQAEEELLQKHSEKTAKGIEDRLVNSYRRIRGAAKNGLAVVPIERQASAGSFIKIPPQRQIDIAQRKRIIVDEHSGRILVDKELADEELTRMNALLDKEIAKLKK